MPIVYTKFTDSLNALQRSLRVYDRECSRREVDEELTDTLAGGVIQSFETAYEQAWKSMKRWLDENISPTFGLERNQFFRVAAENGLLTDVAKWMKFHRARNETSHTYDGDTVGEVVTIARQFVPYALDTLSRLKGERNA